MELRGRPPVPGAVRARFWECVRAGLAVREAAEAAGVHHSQAKAWFRQAGGVAPPAPGAGRGRYLSLAEREEIAVGLAQGLSYREIARRLDRPASTVSREIARNSTRGRYRYRAVAAQVRAEERARRPKPARLAVNGELHQWVQGKLEENWSPEQISARLVIDFPDRPEMRVCHETIYRALYVQGRGALRRELAAHLRTGRALRKPRRTQGERRGKIPDMVLIADRPAEADDRAVPGHWEGDQIVGRAGKSQIGTLVERTTRYTMLVPLPDKGAQAFAAAVIPVIAGLPGSLRRSLTYDQGKEMALHKQIKVAADVGIYFCDPHSPWQRGSNENTNGLLRQYFPKGTDLSVHSPRHLQDVADQLNGRPRKTLGWKTPAEAMAGLLDSQDA